MDYLGRLPQSDPLYSYLQYDILPQLAAGGSMPDFRVYRLRASNHVYLYKDRRTGTRIVGKFFGGMPGRSGDRSFQLMEREFQNLHYLRSLGFAGYPHYVARPLGCNAFLDCLLVEEFCYGTALNDYIVRAALNGAGGDLFQKLAALAAFLSSLHNRTGNGIPIDFDRECGYFERIVEQLKNWGHIGCGDSEELLRLKSFWREKSCVWEDQQVMVHGDVTPTNILFGDGPWVIAVDLERMKYADRVFDLGRVTAEIKHFFMQYGGQKNLAEPFIGHFLWEYACHFPDRRSAFAAITRRVPFYMGVTLLRIARNPYIHGPYRREMVEEAKRTMR